MTRAPGPAPRGRLPRRPRSLRLRLTALLVLLAAAALSLTDVASVTALASFLGGRVDHQLERVAHAVARRSAANLGSRRHQAPTTILTELLDPSGQVVFRFGDTRPPAGGLPRLPPLDSAAVASRRGRPFTVPAQQGGAPFRAVAVRLADGDSAVIAISLADEQATVRHLALVSTVAGALTLTLLAALALTVVRLGLRPLQEMERTAAAIAGGDLARRVPDPDPGTEVGRLGAALNTMLVTIEAAFAERAASEARLRASEDRLRRFVADASHELRTPLTSIQGFAELIGQGAVASPADHARAVHRIEQEARRMARLVEDLLLLARLDEEPAPRTGPVDLAALAADTVRLAAELDPQREWELTAPAPVLVQGDEWQLRQVLTNLLANAREHTPPGTPVRVRVGRAGARAQVLVEDEGPGIPAHQAAEVFGRFVRLDPGRGRDSGGAGLGLSIVAAVCAAHGGEAAVSPSATGGACFRITLPAGETLATTSTVSTSGGGPA